MCLDCYCLYPRILEVKTQLLCISPVRESMLLVHLAIRMYCCACHSSLGKCSSHPAVFLHPTNRPLLQNMSNKNYTVVKSDNNLDLNCSPTKTQNARFDVLKLVLLKFQVFWDVMCYWVHSFQYFRGSYLHLLGTYWPKWWRHCDPSKCCNYLPMTLHNIPEDLNLAEHRTFHCPNAQYCDFEENACSYSLWFEDVDY